MRVGESITMIIFLIMVMIYGAQRYFRVSSTVHLRSSQQYLMPRDARCKPAQPFGGRGAAAQLVPSPRPRSLPVAPRLGALILRGNAANPRTMHMLGTLPVPLAPHALA